MAALTAERRQFVDGIVAEFLHNYRRGRTMISVDGDDPGAAARFAADLVERLGKAGHAAFVASIDGFLRPRAERDARHPAPEALYRGSYDYDLLRRVLVEPFKLGGSTGFVLRAFDDERDVAAELEWATAPADATLVVHGRFLNRPETRGLWSFTIWLEADGVERPPAQDLYLEESDPRSAASAIVDVTDADEPRRVFADSC
jgi:uridine kinase